MNTVTEHRASHPSPTAWSRPADVLVVFGITGDLAKVMTFNSLYRLERRGLLNVPILGVAANEWTVEQLRDRARSSIETTGEPIDEDAFERFSGRLSYVHGDFSDPAVYQQVAGAIGAAQRPVFYLDRELMDSDRWQQLANSGARMQRLLWASTSTKDPKAPDDLYVHALGAPFTVNTVPEGTLRAFLDHGHPGKPMPADGGDSEAILARFGAAGLDVDALAANLQSDGAKGFVDAWNDLMAHIGAQSMALGAATARKESR